mgnify:CR=1 FL=1
MGIVKNVGYDKFPKQGEWLGKQVEVCFGYDTSKNVRGSIIRCDAEAPFETIILLENGRVIRDVECQYRIL